MIYAVFFNIIVVIVNLIVLQKTGSNTNAFWLGASSCNMVFMTAIYCIKDKNNE